MAPKGYRSFHDGPYHYCGRCGERRHLSLMEWQRGVLVCKESNDIDYSGPGEPGPLVGQREQDIIRAFETPTRELEPDAKLVNPEAETFGDDLISF